MRTILEYASPVWDPSGKTLQDELEKVQNQAARFVTGSMTKILKQLEWESFKQRRKGSRLVLFYKGLKGHASMPVDELKTPLRHHHSEPFQVPYARTDAIYT